MRKNRVKSALITGITGQDGSYLAELLLLKNYEVFGLIRKKENEDYGCVEHIKDKIHFIYGDITDYVSLVNAIEISDADEVYNLAAQSFVGKSWEYPVMTTEVDAIGIVKILETIRLLKPTIKFYQASSCEIYGNARDNPQTEKTATSPTSPYGVAKLYGHWITKNYRESYNMFACCGILYNHESERRGNNFVTRKITRAVARIKYNVQDTLELGNLSATRDWGHAKDYVYSMWLMLQQEKADEYVIASGKAHSVREFVKIAFEKAGMPIEFSGSGINEIGKLKDGGRVVVRVNEKWFRPIESNQYLGDPSKAEKYLGWKREASFEKLVEDMVFHDLKLIEEEVRKSRG